MIEASREEKMKAYRQKWRDENPEKAKAASQRWRAANPERLTDSRRQWRQANADRHREMKREWYLKNRDKVLGQQRRALLKKYGLTEETYNQLFEAQGQACAVCHGDTPGTTKGWHIDHCHTTGETRGIVCNHCNLMLGYAKDNETTLANAIEYLRKTA